MKASCRMEDEDTRLLRIFQKQSKELEDDINNLKRGNYGRVTNVFKMA